MVKEMPNGDGHFGSVRMQRIQLHLYQAPLFEDKMAGQAEDIRGQTQRAILRQLGVREHPETGPGKQIVGYVGEQDESFLGCQVRLATSFQWPAQFVSLDFGLAGPPIIIVRDDCWGRPLQDGADHDSVLRLAMRASPAEQERLRRPTVLA